jgi:hypothetical protein
MPKDEFDFDDPLELNGVALACDEDTSRDMAECFVEEFVMLGYNHKQLLALFRNPHYLGMNMVLQNKGEPFVKAVISDVFARWGKRIDWPLAGAAEGSADASSACGDGANRRGRDVRAPTEAEHSCGCGSAGCSSTPAGQDTAFAEALTDPLGNPVPKLNL